MVNGSSSDMGGIDSSGEDDATIGAASARGEETDDGVEDLVACRGWRGIKEAAEATRGMGIDMGRISGEIKGMGDEDAIGVGSEEGAALYAYSDFVLE